MEVWEEPVRGGYPPPWLFSLTWAERSKIWHEVAPFPPLFHLTGLRPIEDQGEDDDSDEAVGVMPASPWLCSPQGRIPLGALAIVADMAFGMALGVKLPPGAGFTTAELNLTRVREPRLGGDLVARGRLLYADSRSALTEVKVFDRRELLVAAGTSRLAVFLPPPELSPVPEIWDPIVNPAYDTPDPREREPQGDVLDADVWSRSSGLEVLEAHVVGELGAPPIGRLMGIRVERVGVGQADVSMPTSEWFCTPAGTMQGGVTALIADTALACAVQTTVDRGDSFLPVDVKVNHLRPVLPGTGRLTAQAEVTHRGRSIAVAHATVRNEDGKAVATATGSALVDPGGLKRAPWDATARGGERTP